MTAHKELESDIYQVFGGQDDEQIFALTLYGEARGESREGRIAVGTVILNRVDRRVWMGRTIKEVCLKPYQFSCFLPDDPNFKILHLITLGWTEKLQQSSVLRECLAIAKGMINGEIPRDDRLLDAINYKASGCRAAWAAKMRRVARIGNHSFYAVS